MIRPKKVRGYECYRFGFRPGSGAGALVLEDLETALARNARIYAEVMGGNVNSGGQRGEGFDDGPIQ
jgi:3-oxoacyl-(acyl-carrier-protein) synthase